MLSQSGLASLSGRCLNSTMEDLFCLCFFLWGWIVFSFYFQALVFLEGVQSFWFGSSERLIMEEYEKEGLRGGDRGSLNGSITSVRVRETTAEGLVKARQRLRATARAATTFTTTAVLETPPHSREILEALKLIEEKRLARLYGEKGTLERGRREAPRNSVEMVDVASSTSDIHLVVVLPEEKLEEGPGALEDEEGKDEADSGKGDSTSSKSPLVLCDPPCLPSSESSPHKLLASGASEKNPEPVEESSCLVDCLYLSMQCCECNIM